MATRPSTPTAGSESTFKTAFAGSHKTWLLAYDSADVPSPDGWKELGAVSVPGDAPPSASAVTEFPGRGMSHVLTTRFTDPNGFRNIHYVQTLTTTGTNQANACFTHYNRPADELYLRNDYNIVWQPVGSGPNDVVSNSQCILRRSGTSIPGDGNNLILPLNIEYMAAFASQTPRACLLLRGTTAARERFTDTVQ